MIPEAVFAMLATARLGAIHSVVFGGFSAKELSNRIDDSNPKLLITASCGHEPNKLILYKPIVEDALKLSKVENTVRIMVQRPNDFFDLDCE
jgi:propionyl-CoA synthetase